MLSQTRPASGDTLAFLGAIMRNPQQLGAIAPSSKAVARLAASVIPATPGAVVVELGAGGGVISDAIRDRLPSGGRQLAVEVNEGMVSHLRRSRPWLEVVAGDAGDLGKLLRQAGLSHADSIVSSLPWTLFEESRQERILEEISASLAPGGTFSTITTLTVLPLQRFRHFRGLMENAFATVGTLGPIWFNVPPALVYTGVRASERPAEDVSGEPGEG
ncbi:methyltransferase domain-containing protein [Streptosporangium sp. NBC_01755]|uniref:class I SAM-dependent methyltransferase n=1 Tax=unclassified Streptosporangium TaxID=2632669 RepID=UPI002DD815D9|nr:MULTISPECIES: methyltransferase domain-containing protein [unclassified Streptosporangium]WSA28325.1 methyltransferase domain-containing protein [Streptosporangium sp. NBC_01810]WSD00197.1 methyltransferase domain-containing protein [Streptosporangium sp. NBC_01755]